MRHNRTMMIINRLLKTIIFISVLVISTSGSAADKPKTETWYQIEVLVYEPVEQRIAGETWPANVNIDIPETAIELTPINNSDIRKTEPVNAFEKLAPETLNLAETANKLIASQRYRIITLQGWQQPVKQRHEAESVHLTDKKIELTQDESTTITIDNGEIILNPPQATNSDAIEIIPLAETITEEVPARIDGTVTVSLSRYLHMALKLRYYNPDVYLSEQIALQKPDEVLINTFLMKQSRRMRSKEVHVFDHPYFGVIATITPIERIIPKANNATLNKKPTL